MPKFRLPQQDAMWSALALFSGGPAFESPQAPHRGPAIGFGHVWPGTTINAGGKDCG